MKHIPLPDSDCVLCMVALTGRQMGVPAYNNNVGTAPCGVHGIYGMG